MNTFQLPIALREGDLIGVFSPSDAVTGYRPDRVKSGCERLAEAGFKTVLTQNVFAKEATMAGTVEQRIADIRTLLANPSVKAMFPTYGGKACNQLLYELPYDDILRTKKVWLGFSDIAVLLNAITAKTGLITFHGPNIVGKLNETEHWHLELVREPVSAIGTNLLKSTAKVDFRALRPGTAKGRLFGGNLNCFVVGLASSKINLDAFNGGIFFWEDLGLTPREINQFLTALRNIGFFERISGMIVGDFITQEAENRVTSDPVEAVLHPTRGYAFPILYAPMFGHKRLENPIFPIGAMCELDTDGNRLILLEECVVPR